MSAEKSVLETELDVLRAQLATVHCQSLIPDDFRLVYGRSSQTSPQILKLLKDNNILSVPVWNVAKEKFEGMVDVLDLVIVIVVLASAKGIVDALAAKEVDWNEFIAQESKVFGEEPVGNFADGSERNPWCPVSMRLPLLSLMNMFGKNVNLHRVPVTDDKEHVLGIVSQSKVIQFLHENISLFPTVASTILVKDFYNSSPVVTTTPTEQTYEAFQQLFNKRVSGLAVVNEKGELVGSLSASDIKRSMESNLFSDIYLPVGLYLEKAAPGQKMQSQSPVYVQLSDSMQIVLQKLVQFKVHRVFVVDQNMVPIGTVSLCDVVSAISG